ncbi:hypothetical protein PQU92_04425 [Asticcacaulis sp. BYS171W]|uniref:Uncharacterized protein n=1 Tax=Asticcacaulis aquaticus TaxID=2984212 RepID=A0ABT5HRF1_9CAUL|nr:hypothetical protein [Asticcacaulis aquaticus]MDC7682508.1 hypothetical protein [Asticcacaulis aquaticus]
MTQDPATPDERNIRDLRRARLRAFGDRMLDRLETLADPKKMDELDHAIRMAMCIERLFARCDAAEALAPKLAAETIVGRVSYHAKRQWEDRLEAKGELPPLPKITLPVVTQPAAEIDADECGEDDEGEAPLKVGFVSPARFGPVDLIPPERMEEFLAHPRMQASLAKGCTREGLTAILRALPLCDLQAWFPDKFPPPTPT